MKAAKVVGVLVVVLALAETVISATCPKPCYGFGATCKNNKCQCEGIGNPNFACYNPNFYYFCSISYDPQLYMFSKQTSVIKMVAAMSLTQVTTKRFAYGFGDCKFRLNAWTERFGGKFYIRGIEFTLYQDLKYGKDEYDRYRITGEVVNGVYVWKVWKKVYNKYWKKIDLTGKASVGGYCGKCSVWFTKTFTNFLMINIKCCKIIFALRPFNPQKPEIIPGVWVKVRRWAKIIYGFPHFLCGKVRNHKKIHYLTKVEGFKKSQHLLTYYALMNGRPLLYKGAYHKLKALQQRMKTCKPPRRAHLMNTAYVMFSNGKLIKIMKNKIMALIHLVTKGICCSDKKDCKAGVNFFLKTCENSPKICKRLKQNNKIKLFIQKACKWAW